MGEQRVKKVADLAGFLRLYGQAQGTEGGQTRFMIANTYEEEILQRT
jgi:hypothetical protein